MFIQILAFLSAFCMVIASALYANKYATRLARSFNIPSYTIGFIIIAIISILPETFIALNSAINGIPEFGFGMLIGSNVIDLTIIIALITFLSRRPIKVESKILKSQIFYPLILIIPIVLGLDGALSRPEGATLIIVGFIFYYIALRQHGGDLSESKSRDHIRPLLLLLLSMLTLLVFSNFVVTSATHIAEGLAMSPVLIGILIIGIGTALPELIFSLRAMKERNDELAIGDILGTVLADATIVVGLLALAMPFTFPRTIIYVAGVFMVTAAFILFSFMYSGKEITQREGFALAILWIAFVLTEIIITTTT